MVCQAVSQTRFRALKHENGIPGRSTVVVRVIACFRPLQNCQAEYFRQLLKPVTSASYYCSGCSFGWMVAAEESQTYQHFSSCISTGLNHMTQHLEQICSLPSGIPCLESFPQHELGALDKPIVASRKRFLIFDRSGNRTRLFVSPSFSCQNSAIASMVPATEKVASGVEQQFLAKLVVEEKWDENDWNDGEGEMLEDAEEINALLYSDSDDEYDEDDGTESENDEVSSTRHTLFSIEGCSSKGKSLDEIMEEVASSDGSPKRRKLLDGSCKKSSLVSDQRLTKRASSCNYKDDVESHYDDNDSNKNEKKVKIHGALKILGSIIPGLNSKDPLTIIEKAIFHLEAMKIEAKALGVS